ncbi:MAG: DEAD/DEAH box helicase family protein [Chloroflexi bacterium]|nr:DEAD/DEAH box helicase family protein [Chloroflexota bacterium]
MPDPEALAREKIDRQLEAAGWIVQDRKRLNVYAGPGVAVREFPVEGGEADYVLFVQVEGQPQAVGVLEAKPEGHTLSGVAEQANEYATGWHPDLPHITLPLPFQYESNGQEVLFRDNRDPAPRSRPLFAFHRPETLAAWIQEPDTLRARLRRLPEIPLPEDILWEAQVRALRGLEASLAQDKPRTLIQMATGAGKTFVAVNAAYRLIKYAKARRILFLVDRNNLGRQAFREFDQFITPDDGRKFTELYNVQHLRSNTPDPVSKVHITTIQRLYSILRGEPDLADPTIEDISLFALGERLEKDPPKEVVYNPNLPIEYYDFIFIDECHRSIYNLWRQVLEYFDAYLIGLTATPSKHTFGFFNQNLVMEYTRQEAVADGVNVDGEVYRIRTRITEQGSTIEAGYVVPKRDRLTRQQRWEQLEEDLPYDPSALDRTVVSKSQIRTVIRTFKEKLFTDLFPGRTEVPKTLIFAKDDSHAEDIVHIVREEFGQGDDFAKKITYRVTGVKPEDLIAEFRNSYYPRIAVTVDMVATGTDIKPIEVLLFMRAVKSRLLFEQMLGRGTRVVSPTELQSVTPDAQIKDRFVIVDAVGVTEQPLFDPQPMERKRSVPLQKLLERTALGVVDEDDLSSLAVRLKRLERRLSPQEHARLRELAGGQTLGELAKTLIQALDPDHVLERAREKAELPADVAPPPDIVEKTAREIRLEAVRPLAANPDLRHALLDLRRKHEQIIDDISQDDVLEAGFDPQATERARETVASFRRFLEEHKDEIAALQVLYNIPHRKQPLAYEHVRELAEALTRYQPQWTTEALWRAYAQLERDRVRGVNERRVLADIVALVRHAVQYDDELMPFPERVQQRYQDWLAEQEAAGRTFTPEQRWWLDEIVRLIGTQAGVSLEDLDLGAFYQKGGRVAAMTLFGPDLPRLLEELNIALVVSP